jgi:hypothetical protein
VELKRIIAGASEILRIIIKGDSQAQGTFMIEVHGSLLETKLMVITN